METTNGVDISNNSNSPKKASTSNSIFTFWNKLKQFVSTFTQESNSIKTTKRQKRSSSPFVIVADDQIEANSAKFDMLEENIYNSNAIDIEMERKSCLNCTNNLKFSKIKYIEEIIDSDIQLQLYNVICKYL